MYFVRKYFLMLSLFPFLFYLWVQANVASQHESVCCPPHAFIYIGDVSLLEILPLAMYAFVYP